jgi:hypothetical protein
MGVVTHIKFPGLTAKVALLATCVYRLPGPDALRFERRGWSPIGRTMLFSALKAGALKGRKIGRRTVVLDSDAGTKW